MGLFDKFKKKSDVSVSAPEIEALVAKLDSADAKIRLEACRALGKLGPGARTASSKLHELTCDDDGDVCNAAAAALSEIDRGVA